MDDDVATSMTRALFLAPSLIDERELDPLLAQAIQNVEDTAEEATAAAEARRAAEKTIAPPRPAPRTFHSESTPDFRASVIELVRVLGRRFVAVIGGAQKTGEVHEWMIGESVPTPEHMARLRVAFHVVSILRKRLDDKAVERWFVTKNEALGERMPIAVICLQSAAATEQQMVALASEAAT